jgi:hypothetical protein
MGPLIHQIYFKRILRFKIPAKQIGIKTKNPKTENRRKRKRIKQTKYKEELTRSRPTSTV